MGLNLISRLKGRIQREKNKILINKMKKQLINKDVSIISQNCIGGVFYHDMGLQFLSPTVNVYFSALDFVKFVSDLEYYLSLDLQMEMGEKFPIGVLGDIKVNFMHYETCTEAKESWNRRKQRVNLDKILVLSTDMEGFDLSVFEKWIKLPYKKVLFTSNPDFAKNENSVFFPQYTKNGCVKDLIPKREFYKDEIIIKEWNNV